ncbi:Calcium-dependent protease [Anaerolineae bacterium]|nr:Calcium-dependent protease [Anaerolineae bacterium]
MSKYVRSFPPIVALILALVLITTSLTPTQAADDLSAALRIPAGDSQALANALALANGRGRNAAPLTIYLEAGSYTFGASGAQLPAVTGNVIIRGQNSFLILDQQGAAQPVALKLLMGSQVELYHLQLVVKSGSGRAILNHGKLSLFDSQLGSADSTNGEGGGIENFGALNLERARFLNNQYQSTNTPGGAVYNAGTLNAVCSQFVGGRASQGGAIYNTALGSAVISRSAFNLNTANGGGAIFSAGGAVSVTDSWWGGVVPSINDLYRGDDTVNQAVQVESAADADPTASVECQPVAAAPIPDGVDTPSTPTGTPAQLNAADMYYYYLNQRMALTVSTQWVAVRFTSGFSAASAAGIADISALSDAAQPREIANPRLTLLRLDDGLDVNGALGAAAALRTLSLTNAQIEWANPVFVTPDSDGKNLTILTDQFIVQFPANLSESDIAALLQPYNAVVESAMLSNDNTFLARVNSGGVYDALNLANLLHESGLVRYAEPNFVNLMNRSQAGTPPNDTHFPTQWAFNNTGLQYTGALADADIDALEAWTITTGSNTIIIADIDEGVEVTHADLSAKIVTGYDATDGDSDQTPLDTDAHGTAVAGLLGAVSNNSLGVAGVCRLCQIMPIRIAYSDSAGDWVTSDAWIANAINWAWQNGAHILSNSWGGGSPSTSITNAITAAQTSGRGGLGSVVVFAAGNGNGAVSYPGNLTQVITVSASNLCDSRKVPSSDNCNFAEYWWGSSYGSQVDVAAPGIANYTTDLNGTRGYNTAAGAAGDYVSNFNGTSSATPIVSGVVGLVLSVNNTLTYAQVETLLRNTADDVNAASAPGFDNELGAGRVNAFRAVMAANGGVYVPNNDLFANAETIPNVPAGYTQEILNSTTSASDPAMCGGTKANTVWYKYTNGASARTATIDMAGSAFDSIVGVYTGTEGSLTEVACNDDTTGDDGRVTINMAASTTYYIAIAKKGSAVSASTTLRMYFYLGAPPAVPVNDLFAGAIVMPGPAVDYTQDIYLSTKSANDPGISCLSTPTNYNSTVWYRFTPGSSGTASLDTLGSAYDTVLAVYTGTVGSLTQVVCNDDTPSNLQSSVSFSATSGTTYYVMIAKYGGTVPTTTTMLDLNGTIPAASAQPGTIVQVSPSGNITLRTPTFTWQKDANSLSYDIQIVRNDVTVIHNQNYASGAVCGASTCSITPALDLDSDYYSWWVRGVNGSGNGPWSGQGFAMTILPGLVTQTAPIGGYNGRSPTFTWNRERDSHEYGIWIGQGSTTLHLAYIQASTYCNSTTCSYTPALDLDSDYYVWWIGGYSLGGGGNWTGTGFHVTVVPGLLTQTAPIGAYNGRTPTFTWDRDRDSKEYGIWIGQGGTTLHLAYIQASTYCNVTTCSYTPALDLSSDYYTWWVGGYSLGGGGPWNGNGFHVTVTPSAVVQLGPQGTINQSNPSFTWERDRDSHEYGIWIGQGSTPVHQTTVQANTVCPSQTPGSTCTYTPTLNLTAGGYSWWVGGYSLGGGGPWSSMIFTVQ